MNTIFTLTVLAHNHGKMRFAGPRPRNWGWFRTQESAIEGLKLCAKELFEDGYYGLAVIEEVPEYPATMAVSEKWFKVVVKDYEYGAEEIEKPEHLKNVVSFSMG